MNISANNIILHSLYYNNEGVLQCKMREGELPISPSIEKFLTDLNQIIGWVDQLTEVDTEKVAPTFSSFGAEEGIKKRGDIISDGGYREDVISNAPKSEEGFFLVPKVID